MRICKICKNLLELDKFANHKSCKEGKLHSCKICLKLKNKESRHKYYIKNRQRLIDKAKAWKKGNPDSRRKHRIKEKGCINPTGERRLASFCDICNDVSDLRFDHDHFTGIFRGWICNRCNLDIGAYEKFKRGANFILFERYLFGINKEE